MKILIVDDDLFSRTHMADMLDPFGLCDTASSGQEALEAFERALSQGTPYDLMTLDIIMPGMSGYEVLRRVRAHEEQAGIYPPASLKVIMITSMGDADSILESYDARCDSYLTKPVRKEQLVDRLAFLGLAERQG